MNNVLAKTKYAKVLLTAFKGTSSEKLVSRFDSKYRKLILENNKEKNISTLIAEFESCEYDYIISTGQKPVIKDKVYIELSGTIGDKTYRTDFKSDELVTAFTKSGFSVRISNNAGTSYCNDIYYHGLKYIVDHMYTGKMIFVHIPMNKNISDFDDFSNRFINALAEYCPL